MTNSINPTNETVTVTVADHANGGVSNLELTVDKGTAISAILEQAGVTPKEGQVVNFKGAQVSGSDTVGERGLVSVSANTKAA